LLNCRYGVALNIIDELQRYGVLQPTGNPQTFVLVTVAPMVCRPPVLPVTPWTAKEQQRFDADTLDYRTWPTDQQLKALDLPAAIVLTKALFRCEPLQRYWHPDLRKCLEVVGFPPETEILDRKGLLELIPLKLSGPDDGRTVADAILHPESCEVADSPPRTAQLADIRTVLGLYRLHTRREWCQLFLAQAFNILRTVAGLQALRK